MPLNTLRDRSMSEATRTLPPFWTAGRVASMAARPAPNGDICEWEAEVVLILMMPGGPAGIGLAGGQGPAVPVAGDTFRGGAC